MAFIDDHKELGFSQQARQPQPNPSALRAKDIPDAFNRHWISEENAKASPGLAAVGSFLGNAQQMFADANERRTMVDVYKTQAANERDVETLVGKIEQKLSGEMASTRRTLAASKGGIQGSIDQIGALKPDAYAPEIRAAFKAMTLAEAQAAISEAVDNNDRQTLAAVLDAPFYTTGLPADLRAALKNRYLSRLAPEQMRLLAEHDKAEQFLAKAEKQILPTITSLYEGTGKHKAAQELLAQIQATYE